MTDYHVIKPDGTMMTGDEFRALPREPIGEIENLRERAESAERRLIQMARDANGLAHDLQDMTERYETVKAARDDWIRIYERFPKWQRKLWAFWDPT